MNGVFKSTAAGALGFLMCCASALGAAQPGLEAPKSEGARSIWVLAIDGGEPDRKIVVMPVAYEDLSSCEKAGAKMAQGVMKTIRESRRWNCGQVHLK